LRIGKINATDEEIIEAAKMANMHLFISKLPKQYLTEVRLYVYRKRAVKTSQISLLS
jgi:ABC-type multidrug transport system fused ATPase/permease subunit